MPDFNTLLDTFFLQNSDAAPPTEPLPKTFTGSRITPLIDGEPYYAAVANALATLTGAPGDFVLIANWWLGLSGGQYEAPSYLSVVGSAVGAVSGPQVFNDDPLALDGPGGTQILQDILRQKAQAGVDVRVLGFVSQLASGNTIMELFSQGIAAVNSYTLESIKTLRAEPTIGNKAVLNIIAHPAGSIHSKVVVIGTSAWAVAFTGGIDFGPGRFAHTGHPGGETWHDIAAQVEGPAVQALYDWFKDMWWENLSRPAVRFRYEGEDMPSFLPGTPVLPARALTLPAAGTHHVQSLRTVPKFNYTWYNCLPELPPISFAPEGCFEVKAALLKALRAAQTYVHIEDQSFWSRETLSWVNDAIRFRPNLRVILVTSGAADPNDPEFPAGYLCNAINHGLLEGLTPAQVAQVRFFKRFGDTAASGMLTIASVTPEGPNRSRVTLAAATTQAIPEHAFRSRGIVLSRVDDFHVVDNPAIPAGGQIVMIVDNLPGPVTPIPDTYILKRPRGITIHSKIYLVDDVWAAIGSANTMRRSLYTDLEHDVAFMDEAGTAVRDFRARLYADHFRHPTPSDFNDIAASLHAWEPTWGVAGAAPARPVELELLPLPLVPDSTEGVDSVKFNNFEDVDSRNPWGGLCS